MTTGEPPESPFSKGDLRMHLNPLYKKGGNGRGKMLQDNTIKTMKPLRKPGIAIHHIDNEAILYCGGESALHVLNPPARLIWELCDGTHTVEDMERIVRASFSVADRCDVAKDIRQTIDDFARKGVLERQEGGRVASS